MQIDEIGKSYLGESITAVRISKIKRSKEASYPSLVMLGKICCNVLGTIHARELISLTTHLYLITKILYLAHHHDQNVEDLLQRTNIYSIPLVNIDGANAIATHHASNKTFPNIRKNRHKYKECSNLMFEIYLLLT